MDTFDNLKFLQ